MRAICINSDFPIAKKMGAFCPALGETVEITGEFIDPYWGLYYELERGPKDLGYDTEKFIPCSDIDETERVEKNELAF